MTDARPAPARPVAARAPGEQAAQPLAAGVLAAGEPAAGPQRVVLSLGSNLGDRARNLQGAVDALFDAPDVSFVAVSPVYETEPVGGPPQSGYLNAVLIGATARPALTILDLIQGIEEAFHRTREVRWGPRTLDIDIITFGAEVSDGPRLILPHPRAHERAFVLAPWLDLDPDAEIPHRGRVGDLLAKAAGAPIRRRDDVTIRPPD
ncbi:MAG TPA: 2-amino-4-hydroxy-6-hydroxymethyldihydropteridine diphosphokinase [Streptosporangiaceae bacterium]|nr:2-amino-4-hydroxy-6-hydroxymethyldihydropteridine diphosphokinase [Streptosporangiaceae bacterium]